MVILMLVTVLLISITTAAVSMVTSNLLSTTREEQGGRALEIAESGAENALLRLLRDPDYSGEALTMGRGSVIVSVVGANGIRTITSEGTVDSFVRTVQVEAEFATGNLQVNYWREL